MCSKLDEGIDGEKKTIKTSARAMLWCNIKVETRGMLVLRKNVEKGGSL